MRFHLLQHVSFEGPAAIDSWLKESDHRITTTRLYQGDPLPEQNDFDVLIVMGGPMGVEDDQHYPWLIEEREFIQLSIKNDKTILGVCLGAQLIAAACGARVIKNKHREIGWFDIDVKNEVLPDILTGVFADKMEVFHWHGDTFEIPEGAIHFASSTACSNQGFILNDRVIGLQFHIETTAGSAELLVDNCRDELDGSKFVQSEEVIKAEPEKYNALNRTLFDLLNNIVTVGQ